LQKCQKHHRERLKTPREAQPEGSDYDWNAIFCIGQLAMQPRNFVFTGFLLTQFFLNASDACGQAAPPSSFTFPAAPKTTTSQSPNIPNAVAPVTLNQPPVAAVPSSTPTAAPPQLTNQILTSPPPSAVQPKARKNAQAEYINRVEPRTKVLARTTEIICCALVEELKKDIRSVYGDLIEAIGVVDQRLTIYSQFQKRNVSRDVFKSDLEEFVLKYKLSEYI